MLWKTVINVVNIYASGFGEADLPDGMRHEHRCSNRQDADRNNSRSQADTTKSDQMGEVTAKPVPCCFVTTDIKYNTNIKQQPNSIGFIPLFKLVFLAIAEEKIM